MDDGRDYYEILQVHPRAGQEVIQRAYRTLSRMYHPDANPPEKRAWAQEMMSRLNEAHRVLSDPERRRDYDARSDQGSSSSLRNGRQRGEPSASTAVRSCHWHPQRARVSVCTVCGWSICAECRQTDGMAVVCPECQGKTRQIEEHTEASSHPKRMRGESPKRSGIAAALRELRHTDVLIQAAFVILHLAIGALALSLWIRGLILLVAFRFPGNLHLVWPLAIGASIVTIAGIGVILTSARTFRRPGLIVTGGFILSLLALVAFYGLSSRSYIEMGDAAVKTADFREAIADYSFALWVGGENRQGLRQRLGKAYLSAFSQSIEDTDGRGSPVLAAGALTNLAMHSSPRALKEWLEDAVGGAMPVVELTPDEMLSLYRAGRVASSARGNDPRTWTQTSDTLARTAAESEAARGTRALCVSLSYFRLSRAVRGMPGEALRRADDAYIGFIQRVISAGREGTEKARGPLETYYRSKAVELLTECDRSLAPEQIATALEQERKAACNDLLPKSRPTSQTAPVPAPPRQQAPAESRGNPDQGTERDTAEEARDE